MTDKNMVQNMMGMKFGSYNASVNSMNKAYEKKDFEHTNKGLGKNDPMITSKGSSFANDEECVAIALTNKDSNGKVKYSIWDETADRTYSSGWQDDPKNDKFNSISSFDYKIEDTNGNGIVDSNDLIYYDDHQVKTIEDFLGPNAPEE